MRMYMQIGRQVKASEERKNIFIKCVFFEIFTHLLYIIYSELLTNNKELFKLSPARSKRGNLGPCPHPWRGVVTDPPTHSN